MNATAMIVLKWIAGIVATLITAGAIGAVAHVTTKLDTMDRQIQDTSTKAALTAQSHDALQHSIEHRLDRIERKIDRLQKEE